MAVGRDKPPGLYLALSKLYTYLCKVDQSMALHCFSLFADGSGGRDQERGGGAGADGGVLLGAGVCDEGVSSCSICERCELRVEWA